MFLSFCENAGLQSIFPFNIIGLQDKNLNVYNTLQQLTAVDSWNQKKAFQIANF